MNANGTPYPWWVIPIGIVLSALSIAFIPFMFFYHRDHLWVGRTTSIRTPAHSSVGSEAEPAPPSQHQLISRNDSTDGIIRNNSFSGDSILLNPINSKSRRESQSSNNSRVRRVSIREDNILHRKTSDEIECGTTSVSVILPPESSVPQDVTPVL